MHDDPTERLLTSALAQEIATDLRASIGLHVLITDDEGVIIGSGDPGRVGTLHRPTLDVMTNLEPTTTTAQQSRTLRAKPGITWPIIIAGRAIGTVGITGSPRTVRPFGLIVQRQIEILVRESELLRSRLVREQALRDLVRDIAFFDPDTMVPATLTSRAAELGVDILLSRVAIVANAPCADQIPSMPRLIREVFAGPQDIVAELNVGRTAVLHHPQGDSLATACERLVELARDRHQASIRLGIGEIASNVATLHASYQDASAAVRLGPATDPAGHIFPIAQLRVHQLLEATGNRARTRFVEVLLGEIRNTADWPMARETLVAWATSGFNLVRAAARLHIHRNTLIYRLDKLSQQCGQPLRDPATAIALYFACLIDFD